MIVRGLFDAADSLRAYEEKKMVMQMQDVTDIDVAEGLKTARVPMVRSEGAVTASSATPADLLMHAMNSGADLDRLERLMDMQIKWEQREAHKAYTAAMAEFKRNAPTIEKDKDVSFKTGSGMTSYSHATIGNVAGKIVSALAEHGFSHRWIPSRGEGGMVSVTCEITHKLGHSELTTLEAGLDQSGGKNNIQSMASTITYLERYTLLAATGLAVKDQQDDNGASYVGPGESRAAPKGMTDSEIEDFRIALREAEDEESLLRIGKTVPAHATDAQKAELSSEYTKRRKALRTPQGA